MSPDGFLLAYGAAVAPGRPRRASLVDFAPTILYYLGLPVGRDMDGFARTDLFRQDFTASRPITFIPDIRTIDRRCATPKLALNAAVCVILLLGLFNANR